MTLLAIVDSGPLLASIDRSDPDHHRSLEALSDRRHELIIPALCVAEVCHFLEKRHGPKIEARFVEGLAEFHVLAPLPEEWPLIARLLRRYADLPLGATDASVAVLAARLRTNTIITLDHRHFGVLRNPQGHPYDLLPAS